MEDQIKVILIEDSLAYTKGITCALEEEPDIQLIHTFGTTELALRMLQDAHAMELPDLILLDLNLPGMSGLEAISWIKEYTPKSKILVLTQSNKEADLLCAIQKGVHGYLLKSSSIDELTHGIRHVMTGGSSIDPSLAKFILQHIKKTLVINTTEIPLSKREIEVLRLISEGLLKKEIADKLSVSHRTVATYLERIYTKLQVQNAPAAVAVAYKNGLFANED